MTTPEQRDLVEELKGRLGRAIEAHREMSTGGSDVYASLNDLLLALALGVESPAVQAVARELVGEGTTYTEWCTYWGAEDPNTCRVVSTQDGVGELWTCDELDEARSMHRLSVGNGLCPAGIASRQVTVYRTPWQVVDTEGGEPDDRPR